MMLLYYPNLSFLCVSLCISALRRRPRYMIWRLSYRTWSGGILSIILRDRMDTLMGAIPVILGSAPTQQLSRDMMEPLQHQYIC